MLVLSRKENQRIVFPNLDIAIEILRITGNAVRVGVDAPADVRVLREEICSPQGENAPPQGEHAVPKSPGRSSVGQRQDGPTSESGAHDTGSSGISTVISNDIHGTISRAKSIQLACEARAESAAADSNRALRHALRNRLNTTSLALHLIQKQLEFGMVREAELTLERTLQDLSTLDQIVATIPSSAPALPAENARPHALLVDDDANERELMAGLLRLHGYEVDVVEDGVAALNYLSEHSRPDCVLLDMQMPRMDGKSTITAIRRDPALKDLKVFAVTGMDQDQLDVVEGHQGIDHWFSKPLKPTEFFTDLDAEMRRQITAV